MDSRQRKFLLFGVAMIVAVPFVRFVLLDERVAVAQRRSVLMQPAFDRDEYRPIQVIKRPFPAIVNPNHVTAERAVDQIQPNELVLGVEIDGLARAYPINMLTGPSREIFNDTLGEHAIAATW